MGGSTGTGGLVRLRILGGVGSEVTLTGYDGKKIKGRIMRIEPSVLEKDLIVSGNFGKLLLGATKLYLDSDPANPQLLDSFREYEKGLRIIYTGTQYVLVKEMNRRRVAA